tara:strand:+ start:491 stop:928 length:438 start_codon:yes stop_codon:yes gene_type:complete
MANINIKFNGKEYLLSCEDGQEEHLQELAQNLNEKFDSLKSSLGHIGENKLLLISSITVMDEYFETKKKIDEKKKELNNLTEKFKELKSLVYEYKDTKEKQIAQLIDQNKQIQNQVESSKNNFNEVIENTTLQIEQFLDKVKKIN